VFHKQKFGPFCIEQKHWQSTDSNEAQRLCTGKNQGFSAYRQLNQPDSHLFQALEQA